MALMMVAGSVGILLAYGGTARTIYVPLQVPEAISGGLGGLALIGLGAVLVSVQLARRDAAREREASDEVLGEMAEVMAVAPKLQSIVRRRRGLPDPPAPPASDGGMRADDATDPGG
jgi:hypothetical protein